MFNIRQLGINANREKRSAKRKKGEKTDGTASATSGSRNFTGELEQAAAEQFQDELIENLEQFINDINNQGERLREHPNHREFVKYKGMIRRFLKQVVNGSMRIRRQKIYKRDRELISTELIDEKLYQLGHYLVLEEADHLAIAADIDEIKGLLYDSLNNVKKVADRNQL